MCILTKSQMSVTGLTYDGRVSSEVYVIATESGRLYTGIAKSSSRRFEEHLHDKKRGAKFFRSDRPLRIVHVEKKRTRSAALKREHEIKSLSRKKKLEMLARQPSGTNA